MKKLKLLFFVILFFLILFIFIGILSENNKKELSLTEIIESHEQMAQIDYISYSSQDFFAKVPKWDDLNDESGKERVLGVTKGICSVVINEYPARPQDINDWIEKHFKEDAEKRIINSSKQGEIYYFIYEESYENYMVTSTNKMFYCNYQTYVVSVVCVNELMNEEYIKVRDQIIKNSGCKKDYEVVNIEKEREAIKIENPEEYKVIEKIREKIVKTDVGEEFGIDAEMVVYFINNNDFFKRILRDFPKSNMVIEDKENNRELNLKIYINDKGEVYSIEDGQHTSPDVVFIIPLRDALNLFSNAANLNPLNLISFAVNVRTVPEEAKGEVIGKVLRGEYN